jgi:type VI secretion system secreted protein Hcp
MIFARLEPYAGKLARTVLRRGKAGNSFLLSDQTPKIKGNVTTKGFEGWIELSNIDFSAKRSITTRIGHQTDRETGIPRISEITLVKNVDKSSPYLFEALLNGTSMDKVTISVCKNGSNAKVSSQYILHDVMVSYYEEQVDGASENGGQDHVNLNFTKIEKRYTPYDNQGNAQSAVSTGYDLSTAKVS